MTELLGVVMTAISLLGVLIGFVIKTAAKSTRIEYRVETLKAELAKHEESVKGKFRELFDFKSDNVVTNLKMAADVENINKSLDEIKIDLNLLNSELKEMRKHGKET